MITDARRSRVMSAALAVGLLAATTLGTSLVLARKDRPDIADREDHPSVPPLTPRVTDELSFKGAGAFDLDAGNGAIWVAAHDGRESFRTRLLRVDPLLDRVEETGIDLGGFQVPGEVETHGNDIWVRGHELIKIDAVTQKVLLKTPVTSSDLALGHGSAWTAGARIGPTGRTVAELTDVPGDLVITSDSAVWFGNYAGPARISRIDPATNTATAKTVRRGFYFDDFTTEGTDVFAAWGTDEDGVVIARVDGKTGEETGDEVTIPNLEVVADMAIAAGRLWVAAYGYGRPHLYQIDPATLEVVGKPLELSGTMVRLAPLGSTLWMSDHDSPIITRIDLLQCPGRGCGAGKAKRSAHGESDCPSGIEGEGLEPEGEPIPPRPYFRPFNLWRTTTAKWCVVVHAGVQKAWDPEAAVERGTAPGDVVVFEFGENFVLHDMSLLDSPLPSPVRIVDSRGKGMGAELTLQSLEDCSLASFQLRSRTFESASGDYPCPAEGSPDHDKTAWVVADCFDPVRRPKEMTFTCADGDFRVTHLSWSGWTFRTASARGVFECYGSSCQWERSGTIRLQRPEFCKDLGRYVFTRARIHFDEPVEGRHRVGTPLGCGHTSSGRLRD